MEVVVILYFFICVIGFEDLDFDGIFVCGFVVGRYEMFLDGCGILYLFVFDFGCRNFLVVKLLVLL